MAELNTLSGVFDAFPEISTLHVTEATFITERREIFFGFIFCSDPMRLPDNFFDDDDYRVSPWILGAAGALVLFLALGTTGGLFFRTGSSSRPESSSEREAASWTDRNDAFSTPSKSPDPGSKSASGFAANNSETSSAGAQEHEDE